MIIALILVASLALNARQYFIGTDLRCRANYYRVRFAEAK